MIFSFWLTSTVEFYKSNVTNTIIKVNKKVGTCTGYLKETPLLSPFKNTKALNELHVRTQLKTGSGQRISAVSTSDVLYQWVACQVWVGTTFMSILFPWARIFTLIAQYWLVPGTNLSMIIWVDWFLSQSTWLYSCYSLLNVGNNLTPSKKTLLSSNSKTLYLQRLVF